MLNTVSYEINIIREIGKKIIKNNHRFFFLDRFLFVILLYFYNFLNIKPFDYYNLNIAILQKNIILSLKKLFRFK